MTLPEKEALLQQTLASFGSVLIAYSGGTDSAFLAYAAHQALGPRMQAVIADSASLPRAELAAALAFTSAHAIPTHVLTTQELSRPDYVRNDRNAASIARTSSSPRWSSTAPQAVSSTSPTE